MYFYQINYDPLLKVSNFEEVFFGLRPISKVQRTFIASTKLETSWSRFFYVFLINKLRHQWMQLIKNY
jgi:hypothetical protein